MNSLPKISDAEWPIMRIVWGAAAPLTAAQIISELNREERWHPRTAKTLLNRLARKGALKFERQGREYLYRAAVREKDCARAESESFLARVFGGALRPMVAQLVEEKRLSPEEIKELRRILNSKLKE